MGTSPHRAIWYPTLPNMVKNGNRVANSRAATNSAQPAAPRTPMMRRT